MNASVKELAAKLVEAHRTHSVVTLPEDLSTSDAYAIQDAVFASLCAGSQPAAWKVGGPSDKVEPIGSPIVPGRLLAGPAQVDVRGWQMVGIEIEIAFRFLADAEEGAEPPVEAVVAIELCDTRIAAWEKAPPAAKLADFQLNAGLVIGSAARQWRVIDFRAQRAELWIDGARAKEASGSHSFGDPARLLPWAVRHCAGRGFPLKAGHVVTTGAWTGMDFARAGSEVRAVFPGIGECVARLGQ